ncbi:MAG: hypothetical protein WKF85_00070 [Chitinophagaceae bacterium]
MTVGVFGSAALLFNVFTTSASSLQDLRAKASEAAGTYCAPNSGTDCISSATGNIYPNYTATPYPEATVE